jgi:hypothetical protein
MTMPMIEYRNSHHREFRDNDNGRLQEGDDDDGGCNKNILMMMTVTTFQISERC